MIQAYSHAIDTLFIVAAVVSVFSVIAVPFIKQTRPHQQHELRARTVLKTVFACQHVDRYLGAEGGVR